MKIATTIGEMYPYTNMNPAEAVRMYENTGFTCLDYSFYRANRVGSPFLTDDWLREVEEAGEAAARLGFTFVQAHSPDYNPFRDPAETDYHRTGILATVRSIEACGRLGIPNIVVHTGFGPQCRYPADKEKYFRDNMPFLTALYPAMEKWNVRVCIENSASANMGEYYFFMTAAEMNDFIAYAGHPLLGACWDTGHANMQIDEQYKEITTLGKNLHAVHFQDNNGHSDQHTAPFFGTLDIDGVMRGLRDAGYPGPLTFEADSFLPLVGGRGNGSLGTPPIRVKRASVALLYQIGVACLEAYGMDVG